MNTNRIKETFGRAPMHTKIMLISSALLAISTFLPWYKDVDTYRTGDQFLGVTGPTSFIGIAILIAAAASFLVMSYRMLGKRLIKLPWQESSFYLFVALQSFFLLLVTNSIFFHPKFGINITLKESLFGMTIAFISALVFVISAYMNKKTESISGNNDEHGQLNPLISFNNRSHTPVAPPRNSNPPPPADSSSSPPQSARSFVFGEGSNAHATTHINPSDEAHATERISDSNEIKQSFL